MAYDSSLDVRVSGPRSFQLFEDPDAEFVVETRSYDGGVEKISVQRRTRLRNGEIKERQLFRLAVAEWEEMKAAIDALLSGAAEEEEEPEEESDGYVTSNQPGA